MTKQRSPVGEFFFATSTMVRRTVTTRVSKSRSTGRSATTSPDRRPVSIASNTIIRYRPGTLARISSDGSTVMICLRTARTLGSSVCAHGLTGMMRSMTARAKILWSRAWYFTIDRADRVVAAASVTQACTTEGLIRRIGIVPKRGTKCRSR